MAEKEVAAEGTQEKAAPNPLEADLAAARAELKKVQGDLSGERFVRQRESNELRQLRDRAAATPAYENAEPEDATARLLRQQQEEMQQQRNEMGMLRFKLENPDADTNAVVELVNSDSGVLTMYDQKGNVDYHGTLTRGNERMKVEKMEKIVAEAEVAKETNAADRASQLKLATISGTAAGESEEVIDTGPMTADEMLESGVLDDQINPADPPKPRGK